MAPIVPGQKRYTVLERALKSAKITQEEFDHCLANGIAFTKYKSMVAPPPEELPMPPPALVSPPPEELPMPSPAMMSDAIIARAVNTPLPTTPRKKKKTVRFQEPFHGGVALMSLQEQFDSLADKVLQDAEEGIRRDGINHEIQEEAKKGWWGFNILGR
tara:strand:- start:1166 stop:1642 length:477 start_codon:yes stop_codon:yes gene_type:complete